MKKNLKNMAWMLAATLMMAACSDTLDEGSGNGNSNEYVGDKGYVNIGINLPTTPSTRANDSFEDGAEAEYNVNEVIIALFYGDTEEAATCQWAFKLDNTNFIPSGDSNDNITSYYASGVRMIPAPTGNVYALAIVNPISKFGVSTSTDAANEDAGDAVLTTSLTVDGGEFHGTLSALNDVLTATAITDVTGGSYNDFMMTNAPIANKTSFTYTGAPNLTGPDAFQVTTLAPITVYNNKATAEGAEKDNPIYVERVVAKTQVKIGNNSTDGSLDVTSDVTAYQGAKVQFEGWKLQNTNKKYYPVRKVTDATIADWADWAAFTPSTSISAGNNRFFGTTAKLYRTYWGIDPNYSADTGDDYNVVKTEPTAWNSVGYNTTASQIEYCLENTTTAQTMQNNRLTSVILKGIFTPAPSAGLGTDFFMINNTSAIYSTNQFLAVATAALTDGNALADGKTLVIKSGLTSGLNITTEDGIDDLLGINDGSSFSPGQITAIFTAVGGNIKYYKDGVTYYYATVIKHFGDVETPLGSTSITSASDYKEADHLGRYGVLRNNWYELTINSVSGPGEPEIPDGGGTNPPDKTASYINCEINVLSWTMRSQGVEL